ncbi:hypothetical protein ES708_11638 [subsurface metagenome]
MTVPVPAVKVPPEPSQFPATLIVLAPAEMAPAVMVRLLSTSKAPARVIVPAVFASKLKKVSAETLPVPSKITSPFCSLKVPAVLFQLPPRIIW